MPDNQINMYSTREMQEYIRLEPGVARFMRETFFPGADLYDTKTVDVDIVRKGRPVACMVKRFEDGNLVEDSGYETKNVEFGYLNEFKVIEIDKYFNHRPGENPYAHTSPGVQAAQAEAEALKELGDRFNRAEELMAVEALTKGTFTGRDKDGNPIYNVDFQMRPEHKPVLSAGEKWDGAGIKKNDIIEQIRDEWIINRLSKNGGKMPTDLVLGQKAGAAFLRHVDPDDQNSGISSFRVFRGEIAPRFQDAGILYIGTFPELANVRVYVYSEWYDDPYDKQTKPVFPVNKALLCTRNGRYRRQYGRINHKKAPDFIARFPYIFETPNGKKSQAQLESAPIFVPFDIDTFLCATVCDE